MATNLTVSANSQSGWIKIFVDDKPLLNKPGTNTISLDPGTHYLTYFVQGTSGQQYEIDITSPASLVWQLKGTLSSNNTTGQHSFTL